MRKNVNKVMKLNFTPSPNEENSKKGMDQNVYKSRSSRMIEMCADELSEPDSPIEVAGTSDSAAQPEQVPDPVPSTSKEEYDNTKMIKLISLGSKKRIAPLLSSKAYITKKKMNAESGVTDREMEEELERLFDHDNKLPDMPPVVECLKPEDEVTKEPLPIDTFPKSNDLIELVKEFNVLKVTIGLLDLIDTFLCYISALRLSLEFDPLLMAIIELIRVLFMKVVNGSHVFIIDALMKLTREIIYCYPSPKVIHRIQETFLVAVKFERVVQQLCHNPSMKMTLIQDKNIYFYRGSCILQILCYQMDRLNHVNYKRYWELAFTTMSWLFYTYLFHIPTLIDMWYSKVKGDKECKCIVALHTTIFKILSKAAFHYNTYFIDLDEITRLRLEEMMLGGIQLAKTIVEIDAQFATHLKKNYRNYAGFLRSVKAMHESKKNLPPYELEQVDLLLKEEEIIKVLEGQDNPPEQIPMEDDEETIDANLKRALFTLEVDDEEEEEEDDGEEYTEEHLRHLQSTIVDGMGPWEPEDRQSVLRDVYAGGDD